MSEESKKLKYDVRNTKQKNVSCSFSEKDKGSKQKREEKKEFLKTDKTGEMKKHGQFFNVPYRLNFFTFEFFKSFEQKCETGGKGKRENWFGLDRF